MPDPGERGTMPGLLADRTWRTAGRPVLVVPVGSTEQHGPHLPLDTDTVIARAVAGALADRIRESGTDAVVTAPVAFGASGEHQAFPGTLSIGTDVLATVLVELGRSATEWLERIVFVNGHGGNVEALHRAVPQLRREGRDASWLACSAPSSASPSDTHAGFFETAVMMHLEPERVDHDRLECGSTRPLAEILPELRSGGVAAVSANGVLGDPRTATPAAGERLFAELAAHVWRVYRDGESGSGGRLVLDDPARGAAT
ncbi:mycofactocin biosynthesis peptidyl-dipeptidase MftE [Microbacterium caowuchunii]|nr:mycofactocin biosynthesis peptidyl-dipeptidase MftE [Microbacterium caowuchunii]